MNNRQKKELNRLTNFARKLIPNNWVIVPNGIRSELIPGRFYIYLNIMDKETLDEIYDYEEYLAVVRLPIMFLGIYGPSCDEGNRCLKQNVNGTFSRIDIDYRDDFLGNLSVFTHEMAHVAELRRLSQISHQWKQAYPGSSFSLIIENEEHGLRFLWAYRIFIKRLKNFADNKTIKLCRADFELYENILKCERGI
jgi:hypothetical protein